ncbi:hypothetical protein EVAR_13531_1 [Eumeta japonica]|uniref:Uncharacterized protein n=1 Tax=Eumeta variegata TaxID=151549 RepID=A0A4C1U8R6_EUMVA|nr:hypothetical protein EVAR_13531_1 [Eumeta japonica]
MLLASFFFINSYFTSGSIRQSTTIGRDSTSVRFCRGRRAADTGPSGRFHLATRARGKTTRRGTLTRGTPRKNGRVLIRFSSDPVVKRDVIEFQKIGRPHDVVEPPAPRGRRRRRGARAEPFIGK